eukprot:gnl/MRDRNA2_/MRDRNA2_23673_c0_seq1.p1 gnl/MRDRNA2_/MRDRNA2_23673_c0~~gnl/MRDRNA2_/MRDRNA2_23673_c0_seq1.p1  ORF type:complete len:102 (+),score=12.85 gnl/MRDRNA2_/MRDRNA2_23673_c0_seq1:326-631(+)
MYFLNLDEMLFKAFASEAKKDRIRRTSIRFKPFTTPAWRNYGSTLTRMSSVVIFVCVWVFVMHGDVFSFRQVCISYQEQFSSTGVNFGSATLAWLRALLRF